MVCCSGSYRHTDLDVDIDSCISLSTACSRRGTELKKTPQLIDYQGTGSVMKQDRNEMIRVKWNTDEYEYGMEFEK